MVTETSRRTTSTGKRGREDGSSRRDEIIEVAVRIIRQKGYKAARLEDVANELNISRPTIYHHLRSKEDILREIYDQTSALLWGVLTGIAKSDLPPEEKLRRFVSAQTQLVIANGDRVAVFFQEEAHLPKRTAARHKRKREEYESVIRQIIEDGIRKGAFRPLDPALATYAILGMCNWTYQWYRPEADLDPKAIADMFADLTLSAYSAKPWLNAC